MQKNGCHIWFRPGEKWIPNGLPGNTQLSVQIRYYDENSPTKDREIEEDTIPENLMEKYFDFAVLTAKAQDILRKTIEENFSCATYDELPGNVRVIYSVKRKEGKNIGYTLDDLRTVRVAFDARDIIDLDESKWDIVPQSIYRIVKKGEKTAHNSTNKVGEATREMKYLRKKITTSKPFKGFIGHCRNFFISRS